MTGHDRIVFLRTSLASFLMGSKVWFKREAWPLGPVSISFSQSYVQLADLILTLSLAELYHIVAPWNFVLIGHHK